MAGDKETVSAAMRKAERFRTELLRRGIILVPIIWGQGKEPQMEKKGFGLSSKAAASLPSIGVRWQFISHAHGINVLLHAAITLLCIFICWCNV